MTEIEQEFRNLGVKNANIIASLLPQTYRIVGGDLSTWVQKRKKIPKVCYRSIWGQDRASAGLGDGEKNKCSAKQLLKRGLPANVNISTVLEAAGTDSLEGYSVKKPDFDRRDAGKIARMDLVQKKSALRGHAEMMYIAEENRKRAAAGQRLLR